MKRVLSALCTLMMGVTASASIYDTNYRPGGYEDATDAAYKVCDRMSFNRNDCAIAIRGQTFTSVKAVNVCASVSFESSQVDCLKRIANKSFNSGAADICAKMSFGSNQIACLEQIANKGFDRSALPNCAKLGFESSQTQCLADIANKIFSPSAAEFCRTQISFDSNAQACLKNVAGSYFQAEALNVCKLYSFESSKVACVNNIKNKMFDTRDLDFCSRSYGESELTRCLSTVAGSIRVLPDVNQYRPRTDLELAIDLIESLDRLINGGQRNEPVVVAPTRPVIVTPRNPVQETKCAIRAQGSNVTVRTIAISQFIGWLKTDGIAGKACVVGRMGDTDGSSMLIDSKGRIRVQNATYSQIDAFKRSKQADDLKGQGCAKFICDAIN